MLTKEHARFRTKGSRIFPDFCAADPSTLSAARQLISCCREMVGSPLTDLEDRLEQLSKQLPLIPSQALSHILTQRCELEKFDASFLDWRWQVLLAGQEYRSASRDIEDYRKNVLDSTEMSSFPALVDRLYSDRPANRIIQGFPEIDAQKLLEVYNQQLLIALLVQSERIELSARLQDLRSSSHTNWFPRFRALDVALLNTSYDSDSGNVRVWICDSEATPKRRQQHSASISALLSLLAVLPNWTIRAELKNKNRPSYLEFSRDSGFISETPMDPMADSQWQKRVSLLQELNTIQAEWHAELVELPLLLGNHQIAMPDFVIRHQVKKSELYVELLKFGDKETLLARLEAFHPPAPFLIGIDNRFECKESLEARLPQEARNKVFFFPTNGQVKSKAMISMINQCFLK